jgi:hypothetical protein
VVVCECCPPLVPSGLTGRGRAEQSRAERRATSVAHPVTLQGEARGTPTHDDRGRRNHTQSSNSSKPTHKQSRSSK